MRGLNTNYDPSIDHLRAFAAILILLYHGVENQLSLTTHTATTNPLSALVIEGHIAVSLFMVLSGYIFTVSAIGQSVDYQRFMLNRFLRIYPLMISILVVAVITTPAKFVVLDAVRSIFLFLELPRPFNFGQTLDIQPWTATFWTITPEFQFYFIFPLLLLMLNRRGAAPLLTLLLISVATKMVVACYRDVANLAYSTIFGRIDQLLIGMLLAYWQPQKRYNLGRLIPISIVLTMGGALMLNRMGGIYEPSYWQSIAPVGQGVLCGIFIASYISFGRSMNEAISRPLAFVGTISFSIYLLHQAILVMVAPLMSVVGKYLAVEPNVGWAALIVIVVCLPITVTICSVTYYFIERPFLMLRVRYLTTLKNKPYASPAPSSAIL